MKTTSLHIAFAALLSLLLLASCSRNDEVAVAEGEEGKVQVTFTLKLDNESSASRAMSRAEDNTWGDEYNVDLGNDYDNRINDLQVVIYEGNTFKCKVTNLSFYKNEEKNEYTYLGSISETLTANTEYKIMVFANCADWANITSETNLSDLSYTYNENMGIPMWGVITQTLTLVPGSRQELGEISLLRAVAKVEVSMNVEGYTLQSVSIDNSNKQGYCLPKDYTLVGNTTDLDREEDTNITTFNPYKDSEKIEDRTFTNENGTYYIYLPEYNNSTNAAKIQVTVKNNTTNEEKPYDLEFKDYVNGAPTGDPYDIVRNHIYRYTITGVNDGKLKLEYRVLLWDKVESAIGWNPEIKDGGNAPVSAWRLVKFYKDKDEPRYIDSDYKDAREGDEEAVFCYVLYPRYDGEKDSDGNAKHEGLENKPSYAAFNFHLSEPKGAVWKAWLSNTTDFSFGSGDYTVTDVKKDENGEDMKDENGNKIPGETHTRRCVITGIARDEDYQIQVTANNPWTDLNYQNTSWGQGIDESKKEVYTDLHISISTDNGKTWHDLAINKKDEDKQDDGSDYLEHTYWKDQRRFAGGHDNYIRIWQLKPARGWGFDELIKELPSTHSIKRWWKGDDSN